MYFVTASASNQLNVQTSCWFSNLLFFDFWLFELKFLNEIFCVICPWTKIDFHAAFSRFLPSSLEKKCFSNWPTNYWNQFDLRVTNFLYMGRFKSHENLCRLRMKKKWFSNVFRTILLLSFFRKLFIRTKF